jgi:hypothetical protein
MLRYVLDSKICIDAYYNGTERMYYFIFDDTADDIRTFSLASYINPDNNRGDHPDLLILDEASMMGSNMFDAILDPMLAHLGGRGEVLCIGTPCGHNSFFDLYQRGLSSESPQWTSYCFPATTTDLLDKDYVDLKKKTLPPEIFMQEYECDFNVNLHAGYVYAKTLYQISDHMNLDITYNPVKPVYTAWDLGHSDYTAVWFFQAYGRTLHFIDYYESNMEHISTHAKEVIDRGYTIRNSIIPPDGASLTVTSIGTVEEVLSEFGLRPVRLERIKSVSNGIFGVREMLRSSYFNPEKCQKGIERLKNYKVKVDPKTNMTTYIPIHDESSHGADAIRYVWEGKGYWDVGLANQDMGTYIYDPEIAKYATTYSYDSSFGNPDLYGENPYSMPY